MEEKEKIQFKKQAIKEEIDIIEAKIEYRRNSKKYFILLMALISYIISVFCEYIELNWYILFLSGAIFCYILFKECILFTELEKRKNDNKHKSSLVLCKTYEKVSFISNIVLFISLLSFLLFVKFEVHLMFLIFIIFSIIVVSIFIGFWFLMMNREPKYHRTTMVILKEELQYLKDKLEKLQ